MHPNYLDLILILNMDFKIKNWGHRQSWAVFFLGAPIQADVGAAEVEKVKSVSGNLRIGPKTFCENAGVRKSILGLQNVHIFL